MPLTQIALRRGRGPEFKRRMMDEIYQAMRETFDVPEDDRFMTITEHGAEEFDYGARYLDIARSDELVLIRLTVSDTRTPEQKQALFKRIQTRLTEALGLRPEDVMIALVETKRVNWSFGHGDAQYA